MQQKAATTWAFSLKRETNESAQNLSSNTRIISISYIDILDDFSTFLCSPSIFIISELNSNSKFNEDPALFSKN